jgi:hypothetical protein
LHSFVVLCEANILSLVSQNLDNFYQIQTKCYRNFDTVFFFPIRRTKRGSSRRAVAMNYCMCSLMSAQIINHMVVVNLNLHAYMHPRSWRWVFGRILLSYTPCYLPVAATSSTATCQRVRSLVMRTLHIYIDPEDRYKWSCVGHLLSTVSRVFTILKCLFFFSLLLQIPSFLFYMCTPSYPRKRCETGFP